METITITTEDFNTTINCTNDQYLKEAIIEAFDAYTGKGFATKEEWTSGISRLALAIVSVESIQAVMEDKLSGMNNLLHYTPTFDIDGEKAIEELDVTPLLIRAHEMTKELFETELEDDLEYKIRAYNRAQKKLGRFRK